VLSRACSFQLLYQFILQPPVKLSSCLLFQPLHFLLQLLLPQHLLKLHLLLLLLQHLLLLVQLLQLLLQQRWRLSLRFRLQLLLWGVAEAAASVCPRC
jgi:hypothetical protein